MLARQMPTERFAMMRGGAVYRAAGCEPATVRNWPIKIGERAGEGHKRYGFRDVVMVRLMSELAFGQKVSASRAAFIVNGIRDDLDNVIFRYQADVAASGHWRWEGGPYLVAEGTRTDGVDGEHSKVAILDDEQFTASWQDHVRGSALVVPLIPLINAVRIALEQIAAGEDPQSVGADEIERLRGS